MLHLVASKYGSDPETVLSWTPRRLGLALSCLDAAQSFADRRSGQINAAGGMVFPVISLGGL